MKVLLPILVALSSLGWIAVLRLGDGAAPTIRVGPWSVALDLGVSPGIQDAQGPARATDAVEPVAADGRSAPTFLADPRSQAPQLHQGDGLAEGWVFTTQGTEGEEARQLEGFLRRILTPLDASGGLPGFPGEACDSSAEMLERILELEADLDRVRLDVLGRRITAPVS